MATGRGGKATQAQPEKAGWQLTIWLGRGDRLHLASMGDRMEREMARRFPTDLWPGHNHWVGRVGLGAQGWAHSATTARSRVKPRLLFRISLPHESSDCPLQLQGPLSAPTLHLALPSWLPLPALTIHRIEVVVEMGCTGGTPTLHQQVPVGCRVACHEGHLMIIV
jgi:hypothetical protein